MRKNCICLALYDWAGNVELAEVHRIFQEFFASSSIEPDLGILAESPGNSGPKTYEQIRAMLQVPKFEGYKVFQLFHTIPGYAQLIFGWDVSTIYHVGDDKTMLFCCDQSLGNIDMSYIEGLVAKISRLIDLKYGIGYHRSFKLGPDLYALGMISGLDYSPEEMAERHRIGAWMRERINNNRHRTGYLRDVYPLNVLSSAHVEHRFKSGSFADWIRQSAERGRLRALERGAWLWTVEDDRLEDVRSQLRKTDILLCAD